MTRKLDRAGLVVLLAMMAFGGWRVVAPAAAQDDHESELHGKMEKIQGAMRQVVRQVKDPAQNTRTLEQVVQIQKLALETKVMTPTKIAAEEPAKQAQMVQAYRLKMVALMEQLLKLEAALLEDRNADAAAVINAIKKIQSEGHEEFQIND